MFVATILVSLICLFKIRFELVNMMVILFYVACQMKASCWSSANEKGSDKGQEGSK